MSDRKYRQSGYQDSDRERPREKPAAGPKTQDPAKGPRGRGLGAPTATVFRCATCGKKIEFAEAAVATDLTCPHCGADLHTCTHCASFDSGVRNECRQGGATLPDGSTLVRIAKKRQRNECTLFAPRTTQEFAKEETRAPDDPRAAFDALFKI
jgi:predicted RNA-binding Zn-ribbon protein involved in translation (DUF1610 family)